ITLPGPGVLHVAASDTDAEFAPARVEAADRTPEIYEADQDMFRTIGGRGYRSVGSLNAYRVIRPDAGTTELTADFTLDPGRQVGGRVVDPDGKPVDGIGVIGLFRSGKFARRLDGAEFSARALRPDRPRSVLFWDRERKLAALAKLRGDEEGPLTVKLK